MIRLLVVFTLFSSALGIPQAVPPGSSIEVLNANAEYRFGEEIDVQATLKTDETIQEAFLFLQPEGGNAITRQLAPAEDGEVESQIDVRQQYIPPFTRVYYWFQVRFAGGKEVTSSSYWFDYTDNRFTWQEKDDGLFRAHWYEGDAAFGQDVLNVSRRGLEAVQKLIPLSPPEFLDIYVYASPFDLQSAIAGSGQSSIAGLANPETSAIMISITPGAQQQLDLERQVPHELTHVMLSQSAGPGYARLPIWLVEGLASLSELYPDPEYERAIQTALKEDTLLPLTSLCAALPQDPDGKFLAYAQSAAFTRYLHTRFGVSGIQALVQGYANGLGCEEGLSKTFSISLTQLENDWREDTGGPSRLAAFQAALPAVNNLLPYLLLISAVLIPPLLTLVSRKKGQDQKAPAKEDEE